MSSRWRSSLCLALLVLLSSPILFTLACSRKPAGKRYELQGRVVAVDVAAHQLTIAHQDIPGLMQGMTMPFIVSDKSTWVFSHIAPGDFVHATLVLSDHAELEDVTFAKHSDTEGDATSNLRIPQPGDAVPDFTLVNQDGKVIRLHQLQGKPLLLTFIYTRCPMPDFCLRMSNNFGEILKQLQKNREAYAKTQLLSISIDPQYDTPGVLRSYGERYVGRVDPTFAHWQFATGSPQQVRQAADFFGLAYNQQDGQIVHSLRTLLIGPDGTILKVYSGNSWKPDEVAADIVATTAP